MFLEDEPVNLINRSRRFRNVARVGMDIGKRDGHDFVEIADEDHGLGRPTEFDQAAGGHRCVGLVAGTENSKVGDVSGRTVVKPGADDKLLSRAGRVKVSPGW